MVPGFTQCRLLIYKSLPGEPFDSINCLIVEFEQFKFKGLFRPVQCMLEMARAPRHLRLGKGHPMTEDIVHFYWNISRAPRQWPVAWRQSPWYRKVSGLNLFVTKQAIVSDISNLHGLLNKKNQKTLQCTVPQLFTRFNKLLRHDHILA